MLTICCDASSDYARFLRVCVRVCARLYFVLALAHDVVASHVLCNNNNNSNTNCAPSSALLWCVVSLPCLALSRTPQHSTRGRVVCGRAKVYAKLLNRFSPPETLQ